MMGVKTVVNSAYGEGSKFIVYLTQKRFSKTIEEKPVNILDCSGKKVLVVDDNKLNLKVIKKLFKSYKLIVDIPVIALTADAMEGKKNKYLEVGFNNYLLKPIDKQVLKELLGRVFSKKQ